MVGRKRQNPTELELLILQVLWSGSPQPVRTIREQLAKEGRALAHTSVITILNIMVDKKLLKRKKVGKAYLFSPRIRRESVSKSMTADLIEHVFQGSKIAIMQHLLEASELSAEELDEIHKLIQAKLKEDQ